jgi:signal transduction histidine kinase
LFDCPDNPEIDSYPGVFTQIFTHLVCNALQHAFSPDRPGVLAIRVRCPDENELELVFSDNGCGIPDELHEQVFEPFHPGRKGPHRGGLGLAMTRKLVEERLAGRVWIENTPGGGVTVMIRIPVDSNRSKA